MVLSETSTQPSLRLLLSQVVPGGIQLGLVLRCGLFDSLPCDTTAFDTSPEPVLNLFLQGGSFYLIRRRVSEPA